MDINISKHTQKNQSEMGTLGNTHKKIRAQWTKVLGNM